MTREPLPTFRLTSGEQVAVRDGLRVLLREHGAKFADQRTVTTLRRLLRELEQAIPAGAP